MKGTVWPRPFEKDPKTGDRRPVKGSTWTYQFAVPKADGGRRHVSKGGFRLKSEAEEAMAVALAEHGQGPAVKVEPSKMPLANYLRDEWLPLLSGLKASTRDGYRLQVEKYIVPHIGDVRLCELTPGQVAKLYTILRERGGVRKGKAGVQAHKGLSERTVHKTHVILGSALSHAVEVGMLRTSPVTQMPKKNRPKQKGHARPEMAVWTASEARTFLAAASGDRHGPIYDLALNTGLRRGELAGLRWVDIDLDAGVISVRRNRVSVAYKVHDGSPKSDRPRTVDIDPPTVAMLRAHRRRQLEERLAWGEAWTDTGLVFTREDGTGLHPDTITWHLSRLIRDANKATVEAHGDKAGCSPTLLPTIRLHDLRHTHATLGLAAGVPVKVMQERLGHASSQITLDLYSHVIPGMQADAAAKIGDLLRSVR